LTSDTRYFTLCWNGAPQKTSLRYGNEFRTPPNPKDENKLQYEHALVFHAKEEEFASLSGSPLVRRVLGPVVFGGATYADGGALLLVLSSFPHQFVPLVDANNMHAVHARGRSGNTYTFSVRELYRSCIHPMKFGCNCDGCPANWVSQPGECYLTAILRTARKRGISPRELLPDNDPVKEIDTKDLVQYLEKWASNGYSIPGFEYLRPTQTREDTTIPPPEKVPILRLPQNHFLGHTQVRENKERASKRAARSAQTRKLVKKCETECALFKGCEFLPTKSWRSRIGSCRGLNRRYNMSGLCGPYTEEEIFEHYTAWASGIPDQRNRKELSLIAANAGTSTKILGYNMILKGMDSSLKNVEFISTTARDSGPTFRYEDALDIMKTSWREGDGTYWNFGMVEPPREFTDEEYCIYAALCNKMCMRGYGTFLGHVTPTVTYIEWFPETKSFYVNGHCGYGCRIQSLVDFIHTWGPYDTIRNVG